MISFLNDETNSMKSSFQAGVDTLYNKCVSCGSTPTSKTPQIYLMLYKLYMVIDIQKDIIQENKTESIMK